MSFRRKLGDRSAWAMLALSGVMTVMLVISCWGYVAVDIRPTLRGPWICIGVDDATFGGLYSTEPNRTQTRALDVRADLSGAFEPNLSGKFLRDEAFYVAQFPAWAVMPGLLAWPTVWAWLAWRRRAKARIGLCANCGYDLRGTVDANRPACPECGQAIARHTLEHYRRGEPAAEAEAATSAD